MCTHLGRNAWHVRLWGRGQARVGRSMFTDGGCSSGSCGSAPWRPEWRGRQAVLGGACSLRLPALPPRSAARHCRQRAHGGAPKAQALTGTAAGAPGGAGATWHYMASTPGSASQRLTAAVPGRRPTAGARGAPPPHGAAWYRPARRRLVPLPLSAYGRRRRAAPAPALPACCRPRMAACFPAL